MAAARMSLLACCSCWHSAAGVLLLLLACCCCWHVAAGVLLQACCCPLQHACSQLFWLRVHSTRAGHQAGLRAGGASVAPSRSPCSPPLPDTLLSSVQLIAQDEAGGRAGGAGAVAQPRHPAQLNHLWPRPAAGACGAPAAAAVHRRMLDSQGGIVCCRGRVLRLWFSAVALGHGALGGRPPPPPLLLLWFVGECLTAKVGGKGAVWGERVG